MNADIQESFCFAPGRLLLFTEPAAGVDDAREGVVARLNALLWDIGHGERLSTGFGRARTED